MKKFLVPTDFSETSKNAARYAAQMLNGKRGAEITLYYVYDSLTAGSDGSLLTESDKDRKVILDQALNNLRNEISEGSDVAINIVAEQGTFVVESIERYVRHHGIDMVIMGITGASRLEQIFMGSNTLKLVDQGICPVMIIPPDARYVEIREVGLTSDFKNVDETTPYAAIKSLLDLFKPTLYVINVDSEHYVEITEEYKAEKAKLEAHLGQYNPQYAFIRLYDFLDAINQFAKDREIDFIITIPRNHSFLGGLFRSSTTKKLAYHSHVPIVAIHE